MIKVISRRAIFATIVGLMGGTVAGYFYSGRNFNYSDDYSFLFHDTWSGAPAEYSLVLAAAAFITTFLVLFILTALGFFKFENIRILIVSTAVVVLAHLLISYLTYQAQTLSGYGFLPSEWITVGWPFSIGHSGPVPLEPTSFLEFFPTLLLERFIWLNFFILLSPTWLALSIIRYPRKKQEYL